MQPTIQEELSKENKEQPQEGMMFVGDKGKILAGFNIQNPKIISGEKMNASANESADTRNQVQQTSEALPQFVQACKSGKQYPGNFLQAEYITEAINLYAAALRTNKLLRYDAANVKITNVEEANKYLKRDYRQGWDPASI